MFRGFRIFRLFKIVKNWKKLQELLYTIGNTMKDIRNITVLMVLVMFTFTLLGMELFSNKVKIHEDQDLAASGDSPRANFDSFLMAFTTIFIVLTGEDWNNIMYEHVRGNGDVGIFFFILLIIGGQIIILNLFLAILLENFETNEMKDVNDKDDIAKKEK